MKNSKLKTGFTQHSTFALRKLSAGFTLIETLVAIAILLIAVVAPIAIAGNALSATFLARDQMIATHLAGEAFEIVRQVRDTNIMKGSPAKWDDNIGAGSCELGDSNACAVGVLNMSDGSLASTPFIKKCAGNSLCSQYNVRILNGIYGNADNSATWGESTRFTRKVETKVINNKHLRVIVTMTWTTGSQSRNLVFESLISYRPTL